MLRVRFLHAQVRVQLQKGENWKDAEWGTPINQEDMAVTLLVCARRARAIAAYAPCSPPYISSQCATLVE